MKDKKLMIFPCGLNEIPFVEYLRKSKLYDEIIPVVPAGLKESKNDLGVVAKRKEDGILYCCDYKEAFCKSDCIWIPMGFYEVSLKQQINKCIEEAGHEGKSIYIEEKEKMKSIYGKETLDLYQPCATIIAIGECFEGFSATDVLCELSYQLQVKGYKVSSIVNRNLEKLIGFNGIPSEVQSGCRDGAEKIILWNRYIRHLDETEAPDVILVKVPGGMLRLPRKNWDMFGLQTYYFFQSICPDIVYMVLPINLSESVMIDQIKKKFKLQYDIEIDCCFASNRIADLSKIYRNEGIGNRYIDWNNYQDLIRKNNATIRSPWKREDVIKTIEEIENEYLMAPYELITFQL